MLHELYLELKAVFDTALPSSADETGLVPFPESSGSFTTIFVDRSSAGCWFTLGENDEHNYIPQGVGLRGNVTKIDKYLHESDGYEPSQKLKVYVSTSQGNFMIWTGLESSFGRGLLNNLAAYSKAELSDICITAKPSSETKGKGAKVVFAEVRKPDGSWNNTLKLSAEDAFNRVQNIIGGKSPTVPSQSSKPPTPVGVDDSGF